MGIGRRVSATANGALSAVGGVEKNDESVYIKTFSNITALLLAGVLSAGSLTFACATPAYADEVSDAQNALSAAEARMSQIASEHEALVKQAEELQQQIDEATQGVMDAQAAAQTGRNKLGIYATQEYKTGGISLIKVLLESQSISDLVNNMQYFDAIQEDQARQIAEQKQLEATLNDALDDLNKKKDEQVKAISDAEAKQTEAQQVVAQATAHLSDAQAAAEAARLAELQKQAEALKAQQEAQSQTEQAPAEESKGAAEKAEESGNGAASNSGNQSSSGSSSGSSNSNGSGSNNSNSSNTSTSGWQSGVVSAYGSTSDGTLGAHTATGAIVSESSMGVAVPMSMPNYRSYFGRSVEISYGGRTVVAVVNDCGGLGGGSRALDLQPGVWKALGASSCFDWGVRTVSYRFL